MGDFDLDDDDGFGDNAYLSIYATANKPYWLKVEHLGTSYYANIKIGVTPLTSSSNSSSSVDTYLYVVDTTSAVKCQSNDDSGGNLQASITKDLIGGRTYFIVVSTYHITNTTGQFYLDVSRQ